MYHNFVHAYNRNSFSVGLPDPPANVHCEVGPQDGTLLITWNPVINQPKPPSRAAVAGYLINADGKKIKDIETPTGTQTISNICANALPLCYYCIRIMTDRKCGTIALRP